MPALAVAPLRCSHLARKPAHVARSATRCAATRQPVRCAAAVPRDGLPLKALALAAWVSVTLACAAPAFAAVDASCSKSCYKECIALAPKSDAYCKDNCDGACDSSAKDAPRDE